MSPCLFQFLETPLSLWHFWVAPFTPGNRVSDPRTTLSNPPARGWLRGAAEWGEWHLVVDVTYGPRTPRC